MKKAGGMPALPGCALQLAEIFPLGRLHPSAVGWAEKRSSREKWGVALSGGADSLALLLLLWAHWPKRRRALVVLHFNHRLRGRAARGDAVFCRKVAEVLGLKFVAGEWADARRGASEAEARAARLRFFAQHARVLWFGHQQDDVAETLLMRLARGSGTGGLAAPRPVQTLGETRVHLRPLLTLKKAELVAGLRAAGLTWREDATNAGADFFRNRIRAAVVPAWIDAAQRDAVAGAARARELLEEDDAALDAWLAELALFTAGAELRLDRLVGKPRALLRRALHRWLALQPQAGELSRQAFDDLLAALAAGRPTRRSLGRAGFAVIRRDRLRFEPVANTGRKFQRRAN